MYPSVWVVAQQPCDIREIEGQTFIVICAQKVAVTSALSSSPPRPVTLMQHAFPSRSVVICFHYSTDENR